MFFDYFYTSFTNATAFSPTDVMPLTRWAKFAMMLESALSLMLAVLVIARAVNILNYRAHGARGSEGLDEDGEVPVSLRPVSNGTAPTSGSSSTSRVLPKLPGVTLTTSTSAFGNSASIERGKCVRPVSNSRTRWSVTMIGRYRRYDW